MRNIIIPTNFLPGGIDGPGLTKGVCNEQEDPFFDSLLVTKVRVAELDPRDENFEAKMHELVATLGQLGSLHEDGMVEISFLMNPAENIN